MKNHGLELKLPLDYTSSDIEKALKRKGVKNPGRYNIVRKSLDARKKNNIHWVLKIDTKTASPDFKKIEDEVLNLPYKKRETHVVITGSGPAGIFSGLVLLKSGFRVTLIEKGGQIEDRDSAIARLVTEGDFNPDSNFAFGEGGAGTFSDGKLTSRSKKINREKDFILAAYINNGAPEEIYSMVHPHIGSDNLKIIAKNMRAQFKDLGGEILFNTSFLSFTKHSENIKSVVTSNGVIDCNYLIMATGHSSFPTYNELIKAGVTFKTKNFALGFRAEHRQEIINRAQWGREKIAGLKAAEYRLTSKSGDRPVFTFCMCPGGTIVPAAAMPKTSVVNGMSNYMRNGEFANAAVVAGFNFSEIHGREVPPMEALEMLSKLESSYFEATSGFSVPGMKVSEFINNREPSIIKSSSYPLGTTPYDLKALLPPEVIPPLKEGLINFSRKISGYDEGHIMGLESKTSAPIQVERSKEGLCAGFNNLYMAGEGSGWAGGIISSGADGIKSALDIISRES